MIVDEISFATNKIIQKINKQLCRLKNPLLPFGGINVIFCGDLRQLEPIEGKPLYYKNDKFASEFKNSINCYIELNGKHRFAEDPAWGELLERFRNGSPTTDDIKKINSRVQKPNTKLPSDIKFATYSNKDRDIINNAIFHDKIKF